MKLWKSEQKAIEKHFNPCNINGKLRFSKRISSSNFRKNNI